MSGPVAYSRFPAAVKGPGIDTRRAAIVVADGYANVAYAVDPKGRTVDQTATFQVVTVERLANRGTLLRGPDGEEWTVSAGDGCGCKSPLRNWYQARLGSPRKVGT